MGVRAKIKKVLKNFVQKMHLDREKKSISSSECLFPLFASYV